MKKSATWTICVLTLLMTADPIPGLLAQQSNSQNRSKRGAILQGRVVPRSGQSQVPETMVVKLYQFSRPLLQTALVRNGRFLFSNVEEGNYRLILEADSFQPSQQDLLLQNVVPGQMEFVHLNRGLPTEPGKSTPGGSATVKASALALPPEAAKELERAARASRKLEETRREYRLFLKKEPDGPRADFIRSQLKSISP